MIGSLSHTNISLSSRYVGILTAASKLDRVGMGMLRGALVLVLVWIGGLKFVDYESDSIVPLVANSPVMRFLYHQPGAYRTHLNKEGELNPQHWAWNRDNGTYTFSHWLGAAIVCIGLLIACYPINPGLSAPPHHCVLQNTPAKGYPCTPPFFS
jgi:reactive chlorine resistance protein C